MDTDDMQVKLADGKIDRAWLDAHNAKVRAYWARIMPLIEAMTDDQCREVLRLGKDEGFSMNRIAERMKGLLGGDWDEPYNPGVGGAIYQEALTRLDEYDDDFRPRPERQYMGEIAGADVFYLTAEGEYEVVAGDRRERFEALYRPKFGMDVDDVARAVRIGEALKAAAGK